MLKGQILLYQHDKSDSIYLIKEGYVKVYDITARGEEKLLLILKPGDMYPEFWSLGGAQPLLYFYESLSDVELCSMPKTKLNKLISDDHSATKNILKYYMTRTRDLMSRLESIEGTNASYKVGHVLQYLVRVHGKDMGKLKSEIQLPITHQNIADMAGVTRETASIQIKMLADKKVILSNGALTVYKNKLEKMLSGKS